MISKRYFSVLYIFLFLASNLLAQHNFVLVLDAGHGGRDPGAVGAISQEKNINLAVSLKLGALIEKNHPDVRVIYTRKDDTFVPLMDRARVANQNRANLFISIHSNSATNRNAVGTETFVLGTSRTQSTRESVMRENAVILLEDDHETRYEGFNPNDPSSLIMFEFMQNRYRDNSIEFAAMVQHHFTNDLNRVNRGVKEGEFLVLLHSATPAVLIELGFISNLEEERFLHSERGQRQLAQAISDAFDTYKREHDRRSGIASARPSAVANESNNAAQTPVFKVQIFSSRTILRANDRNLRGLQNFEFHHENGLYKYTTGRSSNFTEIQALRNELQTQFPGAFIVAFLGDRKISVAEAQRMLNQ